MICPYCFLEIDNIDNLIDHLKYRHNYPLDISKECVINRLKRIGINIDENESKKNQ